jgi:fatty-acid desaturase
VEKTPPLGCFFFWPVASRPAKYLLLLLHMNKHLVFIFLFLSALFATTHWFAVEASLYWYLWWFDLVMHFWGGMMIALGVHMLSSFSIFPFRPVLPVILAVLLFVTGVWEVFEWSVGLFDPVSHFRDTSIDIIMGFGGGILAHLGLRRYTR